MISEANKLKKELKLHTGRIFQIAGVFGACKPLWLNSGGNGGPLNDIDIDVYLSYGKKAGLQNDFINKSPTPFDWIY